jgi:hypothetical protein
LVSGPPRYHRLTHSFPLPSCKVPYVIVSPCCFKVSRSGASALSLTGCDLIPVIYPSHCKNVPHNLQQIRFWLRVKGVSYNPCCSYGVNCLLKLNTGFSLLSPFNSLCTICMSARCHSSSIVSLTSFSWPSVMLTDARHHAQARLNPFQAIEVSPRPWATRLVPQTPSVS